MRALESLCVVEMAFVVATFFTAYPRHASGSVVNARSGYRGQTTAKLTKYTDFRFQPRACSTAAFLELAMLAGRYLPPLQSLEH